MNSVLRPSAFEVRSPAAGGDVPPMTSATAMAGVPAFVRETFGYNALKRANEATMLDIEMIDTLDCFIPQVTMTTFLDAVERSAGEPNLGLLIAPQVSVSNFGLWGEYVLAADTLRTAIVRCASSLDYNCTGDHIVLSVNDRKARLRYVSAVRGRPGYTHLACGVAGAMLSLLRSFLPSGWKPRMVELDIPRPPSSTPFEDTFSCPVTFDAVGVSILFDARLLDRRAAWHSPVRLLTLEDVARGRFAPAKLDTFLDVVVAQIWAQVLAGAVSVDSTARALDMSVRSLQRELNREGASFRALTNAVRVQRAKELLKGTGASIIDISTALGYTAPANFARAFQREIGLNPSQYRQRTSWPASAGPHDD